MSDKPTRTIDTPTGGEPVRAVIGALTELAADGAGDVRRVAVAHDPGCPCVTEQRAMSSCTCEIVELAIGEPE